MANLSEEERLAAHRAFVRLEEWFRAVEMQHDRCLGRPVGRPGIDVPEEVNREEWYRKQRDIDFYLFSLFLLRRAVRVALRKVPGAAQGLGPALQAFDAAVPAATGCATSSSTLTL